MLCYGSQSTVLHLPFTPLRPGLLSSYITQTKQLVKDVRKLQNELMEKSSHIEQPLNNCMEQLLVLMAKKQGIQWETGKAERQEEQEELSHLYYNRLLHFYKLNLCNVC